MGTANRAFWPLVVLLWFTGCGGFRPVKRGDWQHIWVAEFEHHTQASPQEVITRDAYEAEVASSVRRAWDPPIGWVAPRLDEDTTVELATGKILEFTLDEAEPVRLEQQGDAATVYWNPPMEFEEWKDGRERVQRFSQVLVKGRRSGQAVVKVFRGARIVEVTIVVK
jgi:hypothetical protein